ncbi:hypothetical protein [Nannocystis sp.]|jgi:hypothetical protein|uniref:hypothetical protein n=1 Tax=Nannocystis sp. TaxID=1962667 RepID=UPI002422B469|nr:hypothetical protein [Nannocystis sp.]MBK7827279.1 hypothetical protein [Nannocystis sp.]MBK9754691.1 hypothetical protein [Nannocystis sp.]
MKIAGIVISLLVVVLGTLWMLYVRAPAPEVVCQHKIAITLAEVGDQHGDAAANLLDQLRLQCVKEKRKLVELRGKIVYARQARCIMAATTLSAAERCG